MTRIATVIYDDFDDTDLIISWRFFHCVKRPDWTLDVVGTSATHRSLLGLTIPTTASLEAAAEADVVLIVGGPGSRALAKNTAFLDKLKLDPTRQLIASQCSGSLILQAKGLLDGKQATTIISARDALKATGADVVDRPLVVQGNVVTSGGCLSTAYLAYWILQKTIGPEETSRATDLLLPTGEADRFKSEFQRLTAAT
jgi:putative intracellular protease/amidase